MIRAEQLLHPRLRQNRAQQLGGDVAFQQALAVLGKCRVIPRRIVDANTDKPAKQEVELQPIHQLSLRADRVERLQEHRSQELLRRNRRRPIREYSAEKSPASLARASFTIARIVRSG
jgi:hypothetical protein